MDLYKVLYHAGGMGGGFSIIKGGMGGGFSIMREGWVEASLSC